MKKTPDHIAILILAAGASSRMGRPKQLLPWENTSLLEHAIRTAKASKGTEVMTVLGANARMIQSHLEEGERCVENPLWQSGLGSSIACGVRDLLQSGNTISGVLIMLADQPLINFKYVNSLIEASSNNQNRIIATAYKNRAGVPALFPRSYFDELLKLDKDFGAKQLLEREEIITISAGDCVVDIDTAEDYEQLKQRNEPET
ncbi:nucleotidyltransferase family protein [uncultured Zobellia sp.]|uniref:nucleotidyltransferase family protein n=1 Tax=uncultured Zobellia sp. TaxID=255433 RepID=UPI002592966B|nr:nucleotidyltransferase family protein [uncultured Zobellia sp.]